MTCGDLARKLAIEPLPGGAASIEPLADNGTARIEAAVIRGLADTLYRACGQEPPVTLAAVDLAALLDDKGWVAFRRLRVRAAGRNGVTVTVSGDGTETLTGEEAGVLAAVTAALAGQGDIEELAALLLSELPDWSETDGQTAEAFAVIARRQAAAVLASGKFGRLAPGGEGARR